jgi:hypothetical protein
MRRSAKHDGQLHKTLTSLMEASSSYFKWAAQAAPSAGASCISHSCLISFLTFVDSCATYYAASGLPDTLISHVMSVMRSQQDKEQLRKALTLTKWRTSHLAGAADIWSAAGGSLRVLLGSPAVSDAGAHAGDDGSASCGKGDTIDIAQSSKRRRTTPKR